MPFVILYAIRLMVTEKSILRVHFQRMVLDYVNTESEKNR